MRAAESTAAASPACSRPCAGCARRRASTRPRRRRSSASSRVAPQNEETPVRPRTPYGAAKAYGHFLTVTYRESHDLFALLGDPLQPRVATARARVRHAQGHARRGRDQARPGRRAGARQPRRRARLGLREGLRRGDVADAPDAEPSDYVVATGVAHSVRELVDIAFGHLDLDPARYVRRDERFMRPAELVNLVGDRPRRARSSAGQRRRRSPTWSR